MIAEWAHLALVLALPLAVLQALVGLIPHQVIGLSAPVQARGVRGLSLAGAALLILAFGGLIASFIASDFSISTVFNNSHSAKPLVYKISGTWGNHEGSILLWVLIVSLFGGLFALSGDEKQRPLRVRALGVQGLIVVAFLAFTIFTSNPFERLIPAPLEGQGLNPLLQDIGLALHPPLLYFGYVGFSMTFALTVAALLLGDADQWWARLVRPWAMLAWTGLTAGIALGSWWAYYELGWGGFWFWDPVENLSFMPWLTGTAFIHSLMVVEKTGALRVWTLFLGVVTFVLAILGTFVVRSGLLTSVHAFAVDPERGVFILLILGLSVICSFGLFVWRAPQFAAGGGFAPVSREGALVLNNLFLSTSAGVVLLGTFFPLITEAFGQPLTVGKPYFEATFLPFMVPLLALMALGPFVPWQRLRSTPTLVQVGILVGLTVAVTALVMLALSSGTRVRPSIAIIAGLVLGGWLVGGGLLSFVQRLRAGSSLRSPSLGTWAVTLAHTGLGIAVFGMIAGSALVQERTVNLKPNETVELGHLSFMLDGVEDKAADPLAGINYLESFAHLSVSNVGAKTFNPWAHLSPSRRFYPVRQDTTTEAGILTTWRGDIFASLSAQAPDGGYIITVSWRPLIPWLWFGCVMMTLGGLAALLGAMRRARRTA